MSSDLQHLGAKGVGTQVETPLWFCKWNCPLSIRLYIPSEQMITSEKVGRIGVFDIVHGLMRARFTVSSMSCGQQRLAQRNTKLSHSSLKWFM